VGRYGLISRSISGVNNQSPILTRDTISPALARMSAALRDRRPVLGAMGLALASLTRRTWRDASLRALPWPATQTGRPILYRSGALVQSIRVVEVTNSSVTVGTDRPYAVFHQFGTRKTEKHAGLPARPFFPFDASGRMLAMAQRKIELAGNAALASLLK